MFDMRRLAFLASLLMVCTVSQAQDAAPTLAAQSAAMAKLTPLVGAWQGQGWIEMGPRRFEFESSEVFAAKAGGLAIVVEGQHHMPIPGGRRQLVHDAVALIRYDAEDKRYQFITQLASGRAGDYEAVWTADGKFQWTIPETPAGPMKYTITVTKDEYREVGEVTTNSGETRQFFEMNLRRLP